MRGLSVSNRLGRVDLVHLRTERLIARSSSEAASMASDTTWTVESLSNIDEKWHEQVRKQERERGKSVAPGEGRSGRSNRPTASRRLHFRKQGGDRGKLSIPARKRGEYVQKGGGMFYSVRVYCRVTSIE